MLFSVMVTLSASAVPDDILRQVAQKRVFFGHQSVGGNIVDGVQSLVGNQWPVVEGRDAERLASPALLHTLVGKNEEPLSKIADFEAALEKVAPRVDVAFFKFCYVDFDAKSDVEALFEAYRNAVARMQAKYPKVKLVHVTVPLTVVQRGVKAWLKQKILGRAPWGAAENAVRERFNALMRSQFKGETLFDLAALESTKPDGTGEFFEHEGIMVPALVPEYSDDGQHLNEGARPRVAEALLRFLAGLP